MRKPKWTLSASCSGRFFQWRPRYRHNPLLWKDKFETPRHERSPRYLFEWLWFGLYLIQGEDDQYWEQWLWTHEYCDGDESKAKDTWGWVDFKTKQSTWKEYE